MQELLPYFSNYWAYLENIYLNITDIIVLNASKFNYLELSQYF